MSKLFHDPREVDWGRASIVVAAAVILWTGTVELMPAKFAHTGFVILAAVQSALTFLMRSRRANFRSRKTDQPPLGRGGHA